jgi:hypothetical protein
MDAPAKNLGAGWFYRARWEMFEWRAHALEEVALAIRR